MGLPMKCLAPKSGLRELDRSGFQSPGNAPRFISRFVGEKTSLTDSFVDVQLGGGSCFAATQADTTGGSY
jgi:hypothetical protein